MKPHVVCYYDDINWIEYCADADVGTALTDRAFKIRKIIKEATGDHRVTEVLLATGWEYCNPATSLLVVAALTYS